MYCEYCGRQLEDGSFFCSECGNTIGSTQGIAMQNNGAHTQSDSAQNRTKVTFPAYDSATMPGNSNVSGSSSMSGGAAGTRVYAPQQMSVGKKNKNAKNGKKVKGVKSAAKSRFKKRIIAVVAAMVILVGSIGGYFIWRSMKNDKDEAYFKPFSYEDIEFPESGYAYIKNELILTGSKDSSFKKIKKLAKEMSGEIVGYVSMSNDYQIEFEEEKNKEELDEIIDEWSDNDLVASVDYHYVYETDGSIFDYSNDEWWNYQDGDKPDDFEEDWDIYAPYGNNWGVESVWMPKVWEMDQDFKPVKVGIIDTMFDMSHPDLDKKFKKAENNPDSIEYDVATGTDTYLYHGTHVAGIIGATIDNGVGIAGVAQNAELYGFAMAAPDGTLYTSMMEWKAAIGTQLIDGVKAINISMDVTLNDPAEMEQLNSEIEDFLRVCLNKEYYFLIFKAADNAGNPTPGFITEIKPGTVRDHIIVVGGAECDYSEAGSLQGYKAIGDEQYQAGVGEQIDIYAPGVEVDSDVPGGLTENHDGTSVAAPFVAGEAALVWGVNPELTCNEVRDIILNNYIYEVTVNGGDSGIITRPYANAFLAVEAATNESSDVATSSDAKIDPGRLGFGKNKEEGIPELYKEVLAEAKRQCKLTDEEYENVSYEYGRLFGIHFYESDDKNECSYCLLDLNNDGTDELIIGNDYTLGHYNIEKVFTIKDGNLVDLDLYDDIWGVVYLGDGLIWKSHAGARSQEEVVRINDSSDGWEVVRGSVGHNEGTERVYNKLAGTDEDFNIPGYNNGEMTDVIFDGDLGIGDNWVKLDWIPILDYESGEEEESEESTEEESLVDGDWKQAYIDILNGFEPADTFVNRSGNYEILRNDEWDVQYYRNVDNDYSKMINIIYINDDEIPELVFCDGVRYYILSYRNGKVVRYSPDEDETADVEYGDITHHMNFAFSEKEGLIWLCYGSDDNGSEIWKCYDISINVERKFVKDMSSDSPSPVESRNEGGRTIYIMYGPETPEMSQFEYNKEEAIQYIQGL